MDQGDNQHLQSTLRAGPSTSTATTRTSLPFQTPPQQPPLSPQPPLPPTTTNWPFTIQPSVTRGPGGERGAASSSTIQFGLTDQYQSTLSTLTGVPIQQQELGPSPPATTPAVAATTQIEFPTPPSTIRTSGAATAATAAAASRKRALSEMSAEERAAHKQQRTRELARAANERRKNRITAVKEELQVTRTTISGLERNIQELQAENDVMRRLLLENEQQQVGIRRPHGQGPPPPPPPAPPQPPHGARHRR